MKNIIHKNFEVRHLTFKKLVFVCSNESPFEMIKNAFYYVLVPYFEKYFS